MLGWSNCNGPATQKEYIFNALLIELLFLNILNRKDCDENSKTTKNHS
jgi:hypothetical protein